MEAFSLAENDQDFWARVAAHPRGTAQLKGDSFIEFIRRACLHNAPLTNPKDVAWFLASYARDALFRVERQKQLPALQTVRSALEEALGMKFTGEKGEHFFDQRWSRPCSTAFSPHGSVGTKTTPPQRQSLIGRPLNGHCTFHSSKHCTKKWPNRAASVGWDSWKC